MTNLISGERSQKAASTGAQVYLEIQNSPLAFRFGESNDAAGVAPGDVRRDWRDASPLDTTTKPCASARIRPSNTRRASAPDIKRVRSAQRTCAFPIPRED